MASKKRILGRFYETAAFCATLFRRFTGITHDIPYLNQFGTVHGVRKILDRGIRPSDLFHAWLSYGARNRDEFDRLAYECCGMTCLAMILAHTNPSKARPLELFHHSLEYGCYQLSPDGEIRGLFHEPFVKFLRTVGLQGNTSQFVGPYFITRELARGHYVIASVNWEIREKNPHPRRRGGHLVLVTGVEKTRFGIDGFYIHNPSGTLPENQKHHFVTLHNFLRCFSGNVISIWPQQPH